MIIAMIAATSVLSSCASGIGTPPPGGPPDTTAPRVVGTIPANGTLNFRGDEVEIEFSEYMNESQTSTHVVVTPIPSR
ncbi:MAG: Ig-like domain-containing protein, partial [bacterium]|nr:Ig-like domain-containing protein [Candidatus Kapabacteria bacterium]